MKTLKLQRVTRYFGYILLVAVVFSGCKGAAKETVQDGDFKVEFLL